VFFECASFFARLPAAGVFASVYCDPPYAGVTGYRGERFPHAAFWERCQAWARKGARVFVSEYGCPVPYRVVEVFRKAVDIGPRKTVDDILFEVLA
jgi:site-specific DNA-adenine methylase